MPHSFLDTIATVLFAGAIVHTFSVKRFNHLAGRFKEGSVAENLFHLLGEVEIVFALWAALWITALVIFAGSDSALQYIDSLDFTEPIFVFVIMVVAATKPVLIFAESLIGLMAKAIPFRGQGAFTFTALVVGPLLGSFITEPAAITVTALLLRDRVFGASNVPMHFKYLLLGTLFVNISIGGVLTPYAAPPVLMVSKTWGWDLAFMFAHFGWKAIVAVTVNALLVVIYGEKILAKLKAPERGKRSGAPWWLTTLHLATLALIVGTSHHTPAFVGAFLLFLGVTNATSEYQSPLQLREGLLVGSFLAGLVILGTPQRWWLEPVLQALGDLSLFLGATALTAVTDNAALTYLGSQVPGLNESLKYALVAGAVVGGGLTVIANAPNPAGFSILQKSFDRSGVSPMSLFLGAIIPTLIASLAFWFLPHFSN